MPSSPAIAEVAVASLPLPPGASTEATLAQLLASSALIRAKTDNLDVALSTRTKPADTQPVSLASVPTHAVSQSGAWAVSVSNLPATQPVTGTFFQATQPVSGPVTDAQLRATPVPISLAVNTPDVTDRAARLLGHVTVDNASLAVTGTFFQATQPVSLAVLPNQSNFDVALSTRLKPADTLTKVATVDTITNPVKAREDTAAMTWQSVKSAAPLASAVQASTGALIAADYDFDIYLCSSDTPAVGKGLVVEHRNAADNATLQTLGGIPAGVSDAIRLRRYTMALNERIRVIAGTAAGAASSMYVSSIGRRAA